MRTKLSLFKGNPSMPKRSSEKISGKEQAVKNELQERIKKIRNFFVENLPTLNREIVEKKSTKELLKFYQNIINSEPVRGNFERVANEFFPEQQRLSDEEKDELFKKFLILKLPRELIKRQLETLKLEKEKEIPLERLEEIHKKREQANSRMLLGFHMANLDYERLGSVPTSKIPSVTQVGGKTIEIPPGFSHYSLGGLYKEVFKRGGKIFLYFVEGSQSDFSSSTQKYTDAHKEKEWVVTARQLPIIFKVEMTPEIEKELGLERG